MEYYVGTLTLRIRVGHSRSLKDKRQVLRSLKDRLKKRHNAAVAEVGGQGSWQDSVVVVAAVAATEDGVRRILDAVHEDSVRALGRDLSHADFEILAI